MEAGVTGTDESEPSKFLPHLVGPHSSTTYDPIRPVCHQILPALCPYEKFQRTREQITSLHDTWETPTGIEMSPCASSFPDMCIALGERHSSAGSATLDLSTHENGTRGRIATRIQK